MYQNLNWENWNKPQLGNILLMMYFVDGAQLQKSGSNHYIFFSHSLYIPTKPLKQHTIIIWLYCIFLLVNDYGKNSMYPNTFTFKNHSIGKENKVFPITHIDLQLNNLLWMNKVWANEIIFPACFSYW